MHNHKIAYWMIAILLTGCGIHINSSNNSTQVPQAHLFEMTPTSSRVKGEQSQAEPHSVSASVIITGYPTPLPTYLVPSRLITIAYVPTQIQTVIAPIPTQSATTSPTSAQATQIRPTSTATQVPPTATTAVLYSYSLQAGSPAFLPNFANASAGCNWQGIAGQVFNASGEPVPGIIVRAGGTWNGTTSTLLGMGVTGGSTVYGDGGYELTLGTKAVSSTNTIWIQIYDLTGKPLSDKSLISTSSDCSKNLTLVNFKEIVNGFNIYIPIVIQTIAP